MGSSFDSGMKRYDTSRSWRENLDAVATMEHGTISPLPIPGSWSLCGLRLASPIGIPAGPLLNANWLLYYAQLGFDWLVYKTVRTSEHASYPLPNLVPVATNPLHRAGRTLPVAKEMRDSWAVSFGMPSQEPTLWRADVTKAKNQLSGEKVLVVSVVATQDESIRESEASLEQISDDFAMAARWAVESGADAVEANFSCPNVATSDGQLYQQPTSAGIVAERIRESIGTTPLILKIGHVTEPDRARHLIRSVGAHVNGLAMTNSIAARVRKPNGELLFAGQPRGICGGAIRSESISQVRMFDHLLRELSIRLDLIGVGGISEASHVESYLQAGASAVGIATAAMLKPGIALEIRRQLPKVHSP